MKTCKCKNNLRTVEDYTLCIDCSTIYKNEIKLTEEDWIDIPLEIRRELSHFLSQSKYKREFTCVIDQMLVFAKTIVKYKAEFPANHVLKELGNLILSSKLTKNEENLVLSAMAALYLIDETFQIEYREKTKSKVNE